MEPIQECLDVRGFYLHSLTLRQVFIDQLERGHPVSVWRFYDSHMLPMGAEVVLAPHEGEMWVYVPGYPPFIHEARRFSGDPDHLAYIWEKHPHARNDWGCDNEHRPLPKLRQEIAQERDIHAERLALQLRLVAANRRGAR